MSTTRHDPQDRPRTGFAASLRLILSSIAAALSATFLSVMGLRMYGIDIAGESGIQVILFMTLALCAYLAQEINLRMKFQRAQQAAAAPPPPPIRPTITVDPSTSFPPIFEEDDEEPDEDFILRPEDHAVPFSPQYQSQPISEVAARQVVAKAMLAAEDGVKWPEAPAPVLPKMSAEDAAAFIAHHARATLERISAELDAAALAEDPTAMPQRVDAFTIFGVHLYLAGAAGELTRRFLLTFDHGRFLYTRMLETTGLDHAQAVALALNANAFSSAASYQPMIEAGITDVTAHIDVDNFRPGALAAHCAAWKELSVNHSAPIKVTALLSRISRQVLMGAVTGEDRRRIFRTYDSMIALTAERFNGRPAGRFSDGGALLFEDPNMAAQAAVFIQSEMDVLEQVRVGVRYHITIGIDHGFVAEAAGSFYGQMLVNARRMADLTAPKSICISDAIRAALPAAEANNMGIMQLLPEDADLGQVFTLRWLPRHGRPLRDLEYREIGSAADA